MSFGIWLCCNFPSFSASRLNKFSPISHSSFEVETGLNCLITHIFSVISSLALKVIPKPPRPRGHGSII